MKLPCVLVASVANSARSQIAEALIRKRLADQMRVLSPTTLDPDAAETLHRVGVNISDQSAKSFSAIGDEPIDLVLFLGEPKPEESALRELSFAREIHWPIDDPTLVRLETRSAFLTGPKLRQHRFRVARLQIEAKLGVLAVALTLPPGSSIRPAVAADLSCCEGLLHGSTLVDGFDDSFPTNVVVASIEGRVVGTARLEQQGSFGIHQSWSRSSTAVAMSVAFSSRTAYAPPDRKRSTPFLYSLKHLALSWRGSDSRPSTMMTFHPSCQTRGRSH